MDATLVAILALVIVGTVLVVGIVRSGRSRYRGTIQAPFKIGATFEKGEDQGDDTYPPAGHAEIDRARAQRDVRASGKSASIRDAEAGQDISAVAEVHDTKDADDPKD